MTNDEINLMHKLHEEQMQKAVEDMLSAKVFEHFFTGDPRTKKNHSQLTKSRRVIPSKAYRKFAESMNRQIMKLPRTKPIDFPVNVEYQFYMETNRKVDSLNLEGAMDDILVANGILADDNCRIVIAHDGTRVHLGCGKENAGVKVTITKLFGGGHEDAKG